MGDEPYDLISETLSSNPYTQPNLHPAACRQPRGPVKGPARACSHRRPANPIDFTFTALIHLISLLDPRASTLNPLSLEAYEPAISFQTKQAYLLFPLELREPVFPLKARELAVNPRTFFLSGTHSFGHGEVPDPHHYAGERSPAHDKPLLPGCEGACAESGAAASGKGPGCASPLPSSHCTAGPAAGISPACHATSIHGGQCNIRWRCVFVYDFVLT